MKRKIVCGSETAMKRKASGLLPRTWNTVFVPMDLDGWKAIRTSLTPPKFLIDISSRVSAWVRKKSALLLSSANTSYCRDEIASARSRGKRSDQNGTFEEPGGNS